MHEYTTTTKNAQGYYLYNNFYFRVKYVFDSYKIEIF